MEQEEREYISSVTLMILHDELDPESVTEQLRLQPDRAWRQDEQRPWGGWKKFMPEAQKQEELAEQIEYWTNLLASRSDVLAELDAENCCLALSCFVTPSDEEGGTASIILPPGLMQRVSSLGLELRLSFQS